MSNWMCENIYDWTQICILDEDADDFGINAFNVRRRGQLLSFDIEVDGDVITEHYAKRNPVPVTAKPQYETYLENVPGRRSDLGFWIKLCEDGKYHYVEAH